MWVGVPKQVQNYLPAATARNRNGIRQVYLSKKVLYLVDNSAAASVVGEKLEVFFFLSILSLFCLTGPLMAFAGFLLLLLFPPRAFFSHRHLWEKQRGSSAEKKGGKGILFLAQTTDYTLHSIARYLTENFHYSLGKVAN